jgi:anti-anti-sigma factor
VIVLDLSEVELIDAIGLAMLVGTHRRALRAGRDVVLRGTPPRVARMLAATGLDRVLRTEPPMAVA